MRHAFFQGLSLGLLAACGETVNYETREKMVTAAELNTPGADANGSTDSSDIEVGLPHEGDAQANLCLSSAVQHQREVLHFPEIAAGTTCSFGSNGNLSRRDGFIRAYFKQDQTITLPAGAKLCGFSIEPTAGAMHYDDEMFFLVENRVLMATKDYTEYFPKDGIFSTFSWESLRNQVYNQFDQRGLYCVGGADGLSECQLPPTDTTGSIELSISAELSTSLAALLEEKNVLNFSWVTTGDNDDSDCRHTDIKLPLVMHYVPAEVKP
ncbi:MAG TPA: hypothetical protein VE954_32280 [Oligoflexus sp.]|uniref:hypothetical protein n=1 Tax=Oligoflexus sp. TaxID=1971216 RepID=UPI002D68715C|nr:hypothetical protein [Oligoflexus sp.]HYX37805.1 hypothetical protein [Oligoflexus sp.]